MGLYESIRLGAFDGSFDGTKQMGSYDWEQMDLYECGSIPIDAKYINSKTINPVN